MCLSMLMGNFLLSQLKVNLKDDQMSLSAGVHCPQVAKGNHCSGGYITDENASAVSLAIIKLATKHC